MVTRHAIPVVDHFEKREPYHHLSEEESVPLLALAKHCLNLFAFRDIGKDAVRISLSTLLVADDGSVADPDPLPILLLRAVFDVILTAAGEESAVGLFRLRNIFRVNPFPPVMGVADL